MRCDEILENSENVENRRGNNIIIIQKVIVCGLNGIIS